MLLCLFFSHCYSDHRVLHSFPTRRSSDLPGRRATSAYRPSVGTNRIAKSVVAGGSRYFSRMVFAILFVPTEGDRKSTRLNSSHQIISYAVFCLKQKKKI